jgi:hypothetical protein
MGRTFASGIPVNLRFHFVVTVDFFSTVLDWEIFIFTYVLFAFYTNVLTVTQIKLRFIGCKDNGGIIRD